MLVFEFRQTYVKKRMSQPTQSALYQSVLDEARNKFKRWPSAYGSMWVQKTYMERGGTYLGPARGRKLKQWRDEEWIQVEEYLQTGRKVPCGHGSTNAKACRPLKRVNKRTPSTLAETVDKIGKAATLSLSRHKQRNMADTIEWSKDKINVKWPANVTVTVPLHGKKKYTAHLMDGTRVSFGDRRYEHFRDTVPVSAGGGQWCDLNHEDQRRRKAYRARHGALTCKNGQRCVGRRLSPAWFSYHFLW